ncbi:cytochrome b [Pseudofrancisella aestuarii]|uniref:Cytochrome b n=1 Tax=Pseudofrancisella aestuarii TaxID=2670347 RepID=A0ABV9TEU3_9GAMM|nr:cytochrome b/b6 domain-containing protein [Pseudofrancisella aestuarii]
MKYDLFSRILHWTTVFLILTMLTLGCIWYLGKYNNPIDEYYYNIMWYHKSFGITLLIVMLIRVTWFFTGMKKPPYIFKIPSHEKLLANIVHFLLYASIFTMILSGWLLSSFLHKSVPFWGIDVALPLPLIKNIGPVFDNIHIFTAWILIISIGLHIAGVIKHIAQKEPVLERML